MEEKLNYLMKNLEILDSEANLCSVSEKEKCVLEAQFMIAQIIIDDMNKIHEISPDLSQEDIVVHLLNNWTENIRDCIEQIMTMTDQDEQRAQKVQKAHEV